MKRAKAKRYSVLLLYPDYISDGYGEVFYAFTRAQSVAAAVSNARQQMRVHLRKGGHDVDRDPTAPDGIPDGDIEVALIIRGHHKGEAYAYDGA